MAGETKAFASCHACGKSVAVKLNVSTRAYYNCDHCGFAGQHKWQRTSDAYMARITPAPAPGPASPAPAATTPAKPAATPQPAPEKSPRNAGTVLG